MFNDKHRSVSTTEPKRHKQATDAEPAQQIPATAITVIIGYDYLVPVCLKLFDCNVL